MTRLITGSFSKAVNWYSGVGLKTGRKFLVSMKFHLIQQQVSGKLDSVFRKMQISIVSDSFDFISRWGSRSIESDPIDCH